MTLEELGGRYKQLSHGSAANLPAADATAASFQRFSQPFVRISTPSLHDAGRDK